MISNQTINATIKSIDNEGVTHINSFYLLSILKEIKQRRESSLRPATKFVKSTLFQHNDKLIEEFDEVQAAFYDYTEDSLEKDKEHLIEEIIDLQFAAETWLAGLGLDEKQRMQARRKVIAKNQTRGYYCE